MNVKLFDFRIILLHLCITPKRQRWEVSKNRCQSKNDLRAFSIKIPLLFSETQSNRSRFSNSEYFNITSRFRNIYDIFDPLKYSGIIRFITNIYVMYSVSYRYNPNTTDPHSIYKQQNPNIHNFYSVYKKGNYSFPYKFWFVQIIQIGYNPKSVVRSVCRQWAHLYF